MNSGTRDYEVRHVPPSTSPTVTSIKYSNQTSPSNACPTSTLSSISFKNANVWRTTIGISDDKFNDFSIESSTAMCKTQRDQERYVWEMCTRSHNVTPASTVLNSPDNTDIVHPIEGHQAEQRHLYHQIKVGRSPVGKFEQDDVLPRVLSSSESPTDIGKLEAQCLREGEIVIFDDIDTNWISKSNSVADMTPCYDEDILKVTKMIGQLPIADYEGSPRRFGNDNSKQQTKQMGYKDNATPTKRLPGFPRRVSPQWEEKRVEKVLRDLQDSDALSCSKGLENEHLINVVNGGERERELEISSKRSNLFPPSSKNDGQEKKTATFEYLYKFSEAQKVLEEYFKVTNTDEKQRFSEIVANDEIGSCGIRFELQHTSAIEQAYIGHRLAKLQNEDLCSIHIPPQRQSCDSCSGLDDMELDIDSNNRSSEELADTELELNFRHNSRNFILSPETTDYDSNCGDLDSLSNDVNYQLDFGKLYTSMPVLEDGLSSGHASDTENNIATETEKKYESNPKKLSSLSAHNRKEQHHQQHQNQNMNFPQLESNEKSLNAGNECHEFHVSTTERSKEGNAISFLEETIQENLNLLGHSFSQPLGKEPDINTIVDLRSVEDSEHSPTSHTHRYYNSSPRAKSEICNMQEAMSDLRSALQRARMQPDKLKYCDEILSAAPDSPIWVPRRMNALPVMNHKTQYTGDEEEADTDLETDRLLGKRRSDEKIVWPKTDHINDSSKTSPIVNNAFARTAIINATSVNRYNMQMAFSSATIRHGIGTSLTPSLLEHFQIVDDDIAVSSSEKLNYSKSPDGSAKSLKIITNSDEKEKSRNKEGLLEPSVLIEGVLFRARYLGSTQLVCEGQPTKSTRMMQAEEAVSRIKAPEGENQPSTEVDLFISTEKIMVLNTDLKEIMMDHALRTISYIADIGDLVVLMARRRFVPSDSSFLNCGDKGSGNNNSNNFTSTIASSIINSSIGTSKLNHTPKMICHVFESDEAQFIAQSIGQAFQVAYMEFLKANGIEDHTFIKEMDYQEVLNSQEIFGDELEIFAKKELQKEVVVPKSKGEILGVVIVESGWGSMLPTVVIDNLLSTGAAARCGHLNIGDQLIAINGLSLVGLPLSTCQSYIRNAKNQTAVKFTVVPCAPVVEVKIKRPNTKYQLGFSVQNGVICSLLRGGIAERGGVRVGHRIIEINYQSVVAVPHEKIVNLLATSVGEILMKTMPTSMFRLLTGQEIPIFI